MSRLVLVAGVVLAMLVAAPSAGALTITVNTEDDTYVGHPDTCSFREAITAAQTDSAFDGCPAGSGADTISLPDGEYRISRIGSAFDDTNSVGDFDVLGTDALSIRPVDGNAKVTLSGNGFERVIEQVGNNSLTLTDVHVTDGNATASPDGAGILNTAGSLTLERVTLSENYSDGSGGGVAVYNSLDMINSTVSFNAADRGGGFYVSGGAAATVKSSTISRNFVDVGASDSGDGGGFQNTAGTVNLFNTLLANNEDGTPAPGTIGPDCGSDPNFYPRFVLSQQVLGPAPCLVGFDPGTNSVIGDALLGSDLPEDNGGQTPTVALLAGSPAIGAGGTVAPDQCPPTDQTGRARPAGSCDIGAVQYVAPPLTKAKLRFKSIRPKKKMFKRVKRLKVKIKVQNVGDAEASPRICLKVKAKPTRKYLRVGANNCRSMRLPAGETSSRKTFFLVAGKKAKRKTYKVVARLKAKDLPTSKRTFRVTVK